jgi:uncharacterized protein (DUF1499 family)
MARRRIAEEPFSRFALWARRCALFALAVALLALILGRLDFIEVIPTFATLAGALVIAAFAILLAVGAFIVIWREGFRGFGHALLAVAIGIALIAYPAYLAIRAYHLPPLADVTTDTADPPRFEAIARVRPREANPIAYPGAESAAVQRAAFPTIAPMLLAATPQEVHDAASGVVRRRKWAVIDDRRPLAGRREGRIEAVARTMIMGFRDDVVLRVRAVPGGGTRLDIRSASRYGVYDFGANAQRILGLMEEIEEAIEPQPAAASR